MSNTIPFDTLAKLVDEKLATKQDLNVLWLKMTITFGSMLFAAICILDFLLKR